MRQMPGLILMSLAPDSSQRGLVMALTALVLMVCLQKLLRRWLGAYIEERAQKSENAEAFFKIYRIVWKVLIAIVVLVAASGSFRLLGLSIGFLGTLLGWSLQVPIRGVAAWLMVLTTKPFRIGDRISIAGVVGDVTDIQLNHTILNQVGGSVQGEERSGRGILVPNAMLFSENIFNYNYFAKEDMAVPSASSKYMLDEVLVRITFGSDHDLAARFGIDAARQATEEIIGQPDVQPFTRTEFMAWGVLLRVRYKTIAAKRQEVSSRITELIWAAIRDNSGKVDFCFPSSSATIVKPKEKPKPPVLRQ